jgi:hypothetical protein
MIDDRARDRGQGADDLGQALRDGVKAALVRWVLTQRLTRGMGGMGRGRGLVPPPTPQDEATHAWDGQRHFAEDYTFVGVQPGLGVVLRLEQLPGRDGRRLWVTVLRPRGAWALPGGQQVLRATGDDRWCAAGLRLDCETPLHRWSLRYAGGLERQEPGGEAPVLRVVGEQQRAVQASIDLTFVSTAPPHMPGTYDDPELVARCLGQATWDARLLRAVRHRRPHGYVQLGELHGTLALGDALVPVRAASLRTHGWGARDWGACDEAFQCFWATEDLCRGWVHHARFPFVTLEGGFTLHEGTARDQATGRRADPGVDPGADPAWGRIDPVRRLGVTLEARPHGAPARVTLAVGHADGTRRVPLERVSDHSFVVDGRGRVDLALVRAYGPSPGWGLWAGLRRTLPRR